MKYWEYKEHRLPDEILSYLKNGGTLTESGFFKWLNTLCLDGWKWRSVDIPFIILERENEK